MSNLIITIISIALAAVTALIGVVVLAPAIDNYIANTYANQITNDIQQIDSTVQLMIQDGSVPTAEGCCNNRLANVAAQMSNAPQAPNQIIQAPYSDNPYEVYFLSSTPGTPRRYLIAMKVGGFSNSYANDRNGIDFSDNKSIARKICDQIIKRSPQYNPDKNVMNSTAFSYPGSYLNVGVFPSGFSCWVNDGNGIVYTSVTKAYQIKL